MFPAGIAHLLLPLIVGISILLMLLRPRQIPEVYWVGGGALLLIVLRLISLQLAGKAAAEGADVYFFLIGMMLLSELAREHGVFDWLSSAALQGARGSALRLFTLVYGHRHAGDDLHVERCDGGRADPGDPRCRTQSKSSAPALPLRLCHDRQRSILRPAHFQSCQPGCLSCQYAAAGALALVFRCSFPPFHWRHLCGSALPFPQRSCRGNRR